MSNGVMMFDTNACAVELLKMKNSEECRKDLATTVASLTNVAPVLEGQSSCQTELRDPPLPPSDSVIAVEIQSVETVMDTSMAFSATDVSAPSGFTGTVEETQSGIVTENSESKLRPNGEFAVPEAAEKVDLHKADPQQAHEELPSTSTVPAASASPSCSVTMSNASTRVNSTIDDEEAMTIDSSSDEDDIYVNQFSRETLGSEGKEPVEEVILKRNAEYLTKRCSMLMQRIQGIMQNVAGKHISRQLQSALEHPGLNPLLRVGNKGYEVLSPYQRLTKQSLSELQFSVKLMSDILRHAMRSFNPLDDSATEESDTDDDEIVLPDDRLTESNPPSEYPHPPYLPVENNPFIEAIKLEKLYETRQTSLDFSINECEFSLTKSLALRKHCKARKPCFQLEKPSTSSNVINIPVDATSSVKFYHDSKPATFKRVSEMISRRPSLEEGTMKTNGEVSGTNGSQSCQPSIPSALPSVEQSVDLGSNSADLSTKASSSDCGPDSQSASSQDSSINERNAFIPSIKSLGCDGASVLGVEVINSSDPNQSASRCAAIKKPDKNRKVFQLGGIQNIFRDSTRLPSVLCSCFGRDELCALCLGRVKKKTDINHVYMSRKDKLAVLDETFHKTLSLPEDVPLEVLLTSGAAGVDIAAPSIPRLSNTIQQLLKARARQFPPEFMETGPRPKKPRTYDIKPYVESPAKSPKKDNRSGDESSQSPRKRTAPRKSQSSLDEKDLDFLAGMGLGWPRERKDSMRRTRTQEFDIDNIVIPYSMAATTRVEALVYKPIETPRWRVLDYSDLFSSAGKYSDDELEDLSTAAFVLRHNKCEAEEKKRFSQALQKAINSTRKSRRLDSTAGNDSLVDEGTPSHHQIPENAKEPTDDRGGSSTPQLAAGDTSTVITEAMANQALKSLFKVSRRRTVSTTTKVEEEDDTIIQPVQFVDPWPQRNFPLPEIEYNDMVDVMHKCYPDCPVGLTPHSSSHSGRSSPTYSILTPIEHR